MSIAFTGFLRVFQMILGLARRMFCPAPKGWARGNCGLLAILAASDDAADCGVSLDLDADGRMFPRPPTRSWLVGPAFLSLGLRRFAAGRR